MAVFCVADGFVVTSGLYLAVQRVLQVSTESDRQRQSKRERGERDRWSVTPLGRIKL